MSIDRWRVPKGPGTHVLMDGGIIFVPPEETVEFYREYIEAINSGTKLYVVEQKTELFRFFVDLDYKAPEKLKDDDLIQFCSIIHGALGTSSRCLIARARPRPVAEGLVKSGVHIHWPDLIVTRTQALNLRTKIILDLVESLPFDWDKVIDASVYGGSGLRMLWSHKKPTGDPYIPWKALGAEQFAKDPDPEILALFAVRTDEESRSTEVLEDNEPLERFIRGHLEGQERARVKKVQRHEYDGWYVQTDSQYCEHVRKNHKSNHVWFHIGSRRISQRCFDEDCREFKGAEHILPPTVVEQLNNVAVVGSPSCSFLMDLFPDGTPGPLQKVQGTSPRLFGARPRELEKIFDQHPRVRTVGFDGAS
jgi:hypothetical protein